MHKWRQAHTFFAQPPSIHSGMRMYAHTHTHAHIHTHKRAHARANTHTHTHTGHVLQHRQDLPFLPPDCSPPTCIVEPSLPTSVCYWMMIVPMFYLNWDSLHVKSYFARMSIRSSRSSCFHFHNIHNIVVAAAKATKLPLGATMQVQSKGLQLGFINWLSLVIDWV